MSVSLKSGAISTLVTVGGLAALVAFVVYPAPTFAALWLLSEARALRHRPRRDFLAFELSPFAAARLQKSYDDAADTVQRLSDLEAGRILDPDPDAADRLIERYRILRSRISALREIPVRSLRRWSSARAAASACRIGAFWIPILTAAAVLFSGRSAPADVYRALSAVCAAWTVCAMPPLYWIRRRLAERALGDRELFMQRWRPDDDFLDFYLERAERQEAAGRAEDLADGAPEEPAEPEAPEPSGRPKRPWHEVLQVAPDADDAAIHAAYRARIKEYHPDRVHSLGAEIKALAEIVTREVNEAYEEAGRTR